MVTFKSPSEIETMAVGGKILAGVLEALRGEVRPGVTTKHLDEIARTLIRANKTEPAFLNYRPAGAKTAYPWTLCASVNDVVVHGQPSDYALREGDIVSLDLGLVYQKWYLDAAITVGVGKILPEARKLMAATEESLAAGIREAKIGRTLGDVGHAIEGVVKKNHFAVAENLCGHGIGRHLHEDPAVFNFGRRHDGEPLEEGMVIAIEPMVCAGGGAIRIPKDDSYATRDRSLAAHFEHTVAITKNGPRILTEI